MLSVDATKHKCQQGRKRIPHINIQDFGTLYTDNQALICDNNKRYFAKHYWI